MSQTKNIIRNIYLYVATLIGLIMLIFGSVDLIQIGLKTWVFPLAEEEMYYETMPPEPYFLSQPIETVDKNKTLAPDDRQALEQWKKDYQAWKEKQEKIDFKAARRQRDIVRDIALLIVGAALFLGHGYIVRKERKQEPAV